MGGTSCLSLSSRSRVSSVRGSECVDEDGLAEEERWEEVMRESWRGSVGRRGRVVEGLRDDEEGGGMEVVRGSVVGVDGLVGFPSPAFFQPLKIATTTLLSNSSGTASFPTFSAVFQVRAPEWILTSERR